MVLTRRSKYVEWPLSELQEAMRNDKAVEAAVLNILYRELARKVRSLMVPRIEHRPGQ